MAGRRLVTPGGSARATAIALVAGGLTLAGLAVTYHGLSGASPIIWTYSQEEIERAGEGRIIVAAGAGILFGAAVLMAAGGRRRRAGLIALPGVVCLALAVAVPPPGGAWAWLAFLPLAPIAVIAALPLRLARS